MSKDILGSRDSFMNEELEKFVSLLDQHDWFCDAEFDSFGRFVVYVNEYPLKFISEVPNTIGGKQILFHWACAQPRDSTPIPTTVKVEDSWLEQRNVLLQEMSEINKAIDEELQYLRDELDNLEKICGSNILQNIFYEVHDRHNAVTNLSAKFPQVKESLEKLYDFFGFDLIYEELDG